MEQKRKKRGGLIFFLDYIHLFDLVKCLIKNWYIKQAINEVGYCAPNS